MTDAWATRGKTLAEKLAFYIAAPNVNGCMLWKGATNKDGYGNLLWRGRYHKAHRLSWEIANGPIPAGLRACHACDNPPCCNPDHLFLGTQTENIADMDRKKRRRPAYGEANTNAKLTPEIIREIRASRMFQKDIAALYGVTQSLVSAIKRRAIWTHVT